MNIIVDTNIVFSAILNSTSKIGTLLTQTNNFQFYSCAYLEYELEKHRDKIKKISRLSDSEIVEVENLVTSKIIFVFNKYINIPLILKSEKILIDIDLNDVPFLALTMQLNGFLWTGDLKLYNGLKLKKFNNVLTTKQLSILFDENDGDIIAK